MEEGKGEKGKEKKNLGSRKRDMQWKSERFLLVKWRQCPNRRAAYTIREEGKGSSGDCSKEEKRKGSITSCAWPY